VQHRSMPACCSCCPEMGSGACKGVCVAVQDASDDDLMQFFSAWPSEQRKRVSGLLSTCSKKGTGDIDAAIAEAEDQVAAEGKKTEATTSADQKPAEATKTLDEKQVKQVHSAIRWGKPVEEIQKIVNDLGIDATMTDAAAAVDAQNGNLALHIAAQNGHMGLTSFLLDSRANVNAQNFNGQTALHMSVEYDMYFQTKLLLDAKADPNLENSGGHKALTGLEGAKTGQDAWDNPMNILKAAGDTEEDLKLAFEALAAADAKDLDRVVLAQTGMRKRKQCPQHWNADRFKEIMQKF